MAVAVLLVAGIATPIVVWQQHKRAAEDKAAALVVDQQRYETAVAKSDQQRGQRQYDQAVETLQKYANSAIDTQRKAYTYGQIATVYEVQLEPAEALQWYRKAEQTSKQPEIGIYQGIARTSRVLDDNATALQYYKKILALMEEKNKAGDLPFGVDDINDVKSTIRQLEQQS